MSSSNYNSNVKNDKEQLLEKLDINNNIQESGNYNEKHLENINEDLSSTYSQKLKKEKIGLLVAAISVFFGSCGLIYTKIIQKVYPEDFRTIQFLFLRSFTVFFFAIFHFSFSYKKGENNEFKGYSRKKMVFFKNKCKFFWCSMHNNNFMVFKSFNSNNY